jgi:hypothetical protein
VQLNRKSAFLLLASLSVAVLGTGCSGINASQGVSPAMFLFPGFVGQIPEPASAPREVPATESIQSFAPSN